MRARIYVDSSVIGGCEDEEFTALTLQELAAAPTEVRRHLASVPEANIVNLQRIHGYNSVNLREGYPTLEIRAPREVLPDE